MNIIIEIEKWRLIELPTFAESVWQYTLPQKLVQVDCWISIQMAATTKPKVMRPITLTPIPLATPLPQAIVPAANKPVDEPN